ncbi:hypothetical protein OH824_47445 [Streptomyces canus]|nr:hypothetical protein OH824_47445 [Streptomyces canus]
MSTATFEVRIALSFHSLRSCASGRVFRLGGRVLRAAIWFSLARARSETTGRNFSSPSSSTAVTYSCSRSSMQAAIWSLRRAVQRISSCGTPAISITGRRRNKLTPELQDLVSNQGYAVRSGGRAAKPCAFHVSTVIDPTYFCGVDLIVGQ